MANQPHHMLEEADIGSGEKKPADRETEKEIRKVHEQSPHAPADDAKDAEKRKGLVDEDHPFPSKGN